MACDTYCAVACARLSAHKVASSSSSDDGMLMIDTEDESDKSSSEMSSVRTVEALVTVKLLGGAGVGSRDDILLEETSGITMIDEDVRRSSTL